MLLAHCTTHAVSLCPTEIPSSSIPPPRSSPLLAGSRSLRRPGAKPAYRSLIPSPMLRSRARPRLPHRSNSCFALVLTILTTRRTAPSTSSFPTARLINFTDRISRAPAISPFSPRENRVPKARGAAAEASPRGMPLLDAAPLREGLLRNESAAPPVCLRNFTVAVSSWPSVPIDTWRRTRKRSPVPAAEPSSSSWEAPEPPLSVPAPAPFLVSAAFEPLSAPLVP